VTGPDRSTVGTGSPATDGHDGSATDPAAPTRLLGLATRHAEAIASAAPGSARLRQAIAAIDGLGERDIVAASAVSARVLERGLGTVRADLGPGSPLGKRLGELRKEAERLNPVRPGAAGRDPEAEGRELDRYLEKFSRAQPRLEALLAELAQARFALEQDAASIAVEISTLEQEVGRLREFALLAELIDDRLTERAAADPDGMAGTRDEAGGAAGGALARANGATSSPILGAAFAARRRRSEILTHLAVSLQGLAALRIVEASNAEIVEALAAAVSTTGSALRTAVVVAQAVASRRLTLVRLQATRRAAAALAESAAALEAGARSAGDEAAALRAAWTDVRATLDEVEARKARALEAVAGAGRELGLPGKGRR
jgi:uncharacterized protein YaaN involved in tellurite resistance